MTPVHPGPSGPRACPAGVTGAWHRRLPATTHPSHQRLWQGRAPPPPPPFLIRSWGSGRSSPGSGRRLRSYSCRADPDAVGSQEAIGERLILESWSRSV